MAEKPTLSGLELKPETQQEVDKAVAAIRHAGLTPPDHVVMLLEVVGHEMDKKNLEQAETERVFGSPLLKSLLRAQPFQSGTDFEYTIPVADAASREKALQLLDADVHAKILAEFKDVPGIQDLKPETVAKFMKAYREWGTGNAHEAKAYEVLRPLEADMSIDSKQIKLVRILSDNKHHEQLEQIGGNHIYPGDLVMHKMKQMEQASGNTIIHDWPPYKRHETVPEQIHRHMPEEAANGRFEAATDFKDKSPLAMIADHYNAIGNMQAAATQIEKEQGVHFKPVERRAVHVHISDEKEMVLNGNSTMRKAAGLVDTTDAMAGLLAPASSFGRPDESGRNWIRVNQIGYGSDNQYGFQEQRRFAVRGVEERKGTGEIPYGHFEIRLGDNSDPFGIVAMAAVAAGGLNRAKTLPNALVVATEQQYRQKQPGIKVGDIKPEEAIRRLTEDPRLDFIPDKVRHALAGSRSDLPPLDDARAVPATLQAKHRPDVGYAAS